MGFDTNKWFKQQYLKESLAQDLTNAIPEDAANQAAKAIDDAIASIDDSMHHEDFAKAVAIVLKNEYGSHNFAEFMKVLHAELGIKESLSEGAYDVRGITPENIDKVDISFYDGSQRLHGVYIYLKGGRGMSWDKKLDKKEFQKVLDMLSEKFQNFIEYEIDEKTNKTITFEYDPYMSNGVVVNALEKAGYEATTSEFDAS